MTKAKNAILTGASALIVIAVILIVGSGLFLNTNFNNLPATTAALSSPANSTTSGAAQDTSSEYYAVQTGISESLIVQLVSDQAPNLPIQGAKVSGMLSINCNSQVCTYPLQRETSSSNGTVQLQPTGCSCSVGNYTLVIQTGNGTYSIQLSPPLLHLDNIVVVTIGVPSMTILDTHITNAGVCVVSTTETVTNGTGFFC